MSQLLDEPRIAYVSRKVQRFREDVEACHLDPSTFPGAGVCEDLVRDANRLAQDLFALDRLAIEANVSAPNGDGPTRPVSADIAEWAAVANRLVESVRKARGADAPGLSELFGNLEKARQITSADPTERVFRELVRVWEKDTYFLSSSTKILEHPAFLRIVELGDAVVPLLLTEVRDRPGHLVIALKRITGADPVPAEDRGKFRAMADAWVKWGESRQMI